MKDLTKNTTPYGLMKPKHQKRLREAEAAGADIELEGVKGVPAQSPVHFSRSLVWRRNAV